MPYDTDTTVAEDLRAVADFLDAHPELEVATGCDIQIRTRTREDIVELTLALTKALGRTDKSPMSPYFKVSGNIGSVTVWGAVEQELVCRKVVKGTREVPEQIVPAHTVEDVEWECVPLLAAMDEAVA